MAAPEDNLDEFRARLAVLRATLEPPSARGAYVAHTDGACIGNPGRGGFGALVQTADLTASWELFGYLAATTNNRAEALAVLAALEWVPSGSELLVRADSELTLYILMGKYKIKANRDIWLEIHQVRAAKEFDLKTEWVRGHAGDPGNERADYLSRLGAADADEELAERFGSGRPPKAQNKKVPEELIGVVPQGQWEADFVQSVARQLRGGRTLSPKQLAIVERIRARSNPA